MSRIVQIDVLRRPYVEFKKSRHRPNLLIYIYLTIYYYTLCQDVKFKVNL